MKAFIHNWLIIFNNNKEIKLINSIFNLNYITTNYNA